MDPFEPSMWSSSYPQMEDTSCFNSHFWEKPSINQAAPDFYNPFFSNPDSISCVSEASGNTLNFSSSQPSYSTQLISFGSSNLTNAGSSPYLHDGMGQMTVKTEPEMISFQNMDFSTTSPLQGSCQQPSKTTRTPLQAKYHVLAERKRREKLSQRFMALSALLPGLKKLDKTSVIDGAINHLKHLEERLKSLEESVFSEEYKPCLCYHYEEDSPPLKKMEVRILKGDVLIKVNCQNQTGMFTEERFLNEMKKLHLSVTKTRFLPFGDNMVAISAVAQINKEFCMAEEEVANGIRLSILKLVNMKKLNTCL